MGLSISWSLANAQCAPHAPGHWIQLAQAAEYAGLDGLFIAGGAQRPDSFTVAAALCAHTRRVRLTVSLAAEVMLPAALAQAAQSLQSISQQRLCLHLPDSEQNSVRRSFGELLNRDQRSERSGEYLQILRQLLDPSGEALDFNGRYFSLENAGHTRRPLPAPPLLLEQSHGLELIASHADQCLVQADHPRNLETTVQRLRAAATQRGRSLGFATHLALILRDDPQQAWQAAQHWLERLHDGPLPDSPYSDTRVVRLARGSTAALRQQQIHPGLWRPAPGLPLVLVGDAGQVSTRLEELHRLGIEHVVLQAEPSVREVLRFGECVLPALRARRLVKEPTQGVE